MKIKTKLIAIGATAVLSAIAINNKIFGNAEKKLDTKNKNTDLKFKSHSYDWKFGEIKYRTIGEGSPVLFIHSLLFGTTSEEWSKNILELSKTNKIYLIDLLGYGESERADISYSAYLYVFITEVIKEPTAVIASNTTATISAMAYIFNPKNFRKLVLISPAIEGKKYNASELLKKLPLDFPIFGDLVFNYYNSKKKLEEYISKFYSDKSLVTEEKLNSIHAYSHKGYGNNRHLFASYITNKFDIGMETSLPEIEIPVLLVYGEDYPKANELAKKAKELNPKVSVEILGGKNFPNEEDYSRFNVVIEKFFEEH